MTSLLDEHCLFADEEQDNSEYATAAAVHRPHLTHAGGARSDCSATVLRLSAGRPADHIETLLGEVPVER